MMTTDSKSSIKPAQLHVHGNGLPQPQIEIHLDYYFCGVLKRVTVARVLTCHESEYGHAIRYLDALRKSEQPMHPEARTWLALVLLHLRRVEVCREKNNWPGFPGYWEDRLESATFLDRPGCDHG